MWQDILDINELVGKKVCLCLENGIIVNASVLKVGDKVVVMSNGGEIDSTKIRLYREFINQPERRICKSCMGGF